MKQHEVGKLELMSYVAGDITGPRALAITRHINTCALCATRAEVLRQEQQSFIALHPAAPVIPGGVRKKGRILQFRGIGQTLALAACVCIALTGTFHYTQEISRTSYRMKGNADLRIFVKTADGTVATRDNNTFCPGEQIQFTYSCAAQNRFILLSMDTSGAITTFYPTSGDTSVMLQKGQGMPLPNSIVLDAYLGPELYCAVFSTRAIAVAQVREQLADAYHAHGRFDGLKLDLGEATIIRMLQITKQGTQP